MIKGKSALVTGSTSGIGLGIARALAAEGANIMLNGFGDAAAIDQLRRGLAEEFRVKVGFNGADISKPAEIHSMVRAAVQELGAVDILVNNAGIQHTAPVESFPPERWDAVIAINLSSNFHAIQAVLPEMKRRNWGRIINIASAHGLVASPQKAAYVTAKHGVVGLTKVVALETATTGITCNAICPGWVLTPLVQKQIDDRAARESIPVGEGEARARLREAAVARVRHAGADRRARGLPLLGSGRTDPRRRALDRRRLDGAVARPDARIRACPETKAGAARAAIPRRSSMNVTLRAAARLALALAAGLAAAAAHPYDGIVKKEVFTLPVVHDGGRQDDQERPHRLRDATAGSTPRRTTSSSCRTSSPGPRTPRAGTRRRTRRPGTGTRSSARVARSTPTASS